MKKQNKLSRKFLNIEEKKLFSNDYSTEFNHLTLFFSGNEFSKLIQNVQNIQGINDDFRVCSKSQSNIEFGKTINVSGVFSDLRQPRRRKCEYQTNFIWSHSSSKSYYIKTHASISHNDRNKNDCSQSVHSSKLKLCEIPKIESNTNPIIELIHSNSSSIMSATTNDFLPK